MGRITHKILDMKLDKSEPVFLFRPGDLVRLVSGSGPQMTVVRVVGSEESFDTGREWGVHCGWFTAHNEYRQAHFHPDVLKKEGEAEASPQ